MSLVMTRPEKAEAMTKLVYDLREAMRKNVIDNDMNLAEAINASAQFVAGILVGAYDKKHQEVVLTTFPDVVREYLPQWEKIYSSALVDPRG